MLILNLETSSDIVSVSLSKDGFCWMLREERESADHSRQLTVFIQELMESLSLNLNQLDAIAVSAGPGSYTGLRIGVSVAKGICYTLNKPLIAVDTLKSMAYAVMQFEKPEKDDIIVAMQDARRMDAYAAIYNSRLETLKAPFFLTLEADSFLEYLPKGAKIFVCGNAVEKWRNLINNSCIVFSSINSPGSRYMEKLSFDLLKEQKFEDCAYFEPFYMKPPNVTVPKKLI